MSINLPDDPARLRALCARYKKQLGELTRKRDLESVQAGMEEYYLEKKIEDFEALCARNGIDFSVVDALDRKRREI